MPDRKYEHLIVTEDIRPSHPPPEGMLKRFQAQREAGNYMNSFHLLSLNDSVARGALYFDAVWIQVLHGTDGFQVEIQHSHEFDEILGFFGSRQEEAQRLGRILRPKQGGQKAFFYSLVTRDSREEVFANNRQLFLTEQGYTYEIKDVTQIEEIGSQGRKDLSPQ